MQDRSNSALEEAPMREIATAWPHLRPHVREAITTLIDADLIRLKLESAGVEVHRFADSKSDSRRARE